MCETLKKKFGKFTDPIEMQTTENRTKIIYLMFNLMRCFCETWLFKGWHNISSVTLGHTLFSGPGLFVHDCINVSFTFCTAAKCLETDEGEKYNHFLNCPL